MKNIRKKIKIFARFVRLEFMTDLQYRTNFVLKFFATTGWLISELLFINFMMYRYNNIAGWGLFEIAALVAVNQIWIGFAFYFMIWPSLATFARDVREGRADQYFLKPVSARFLVSIFRLDWSSLTIGLNGVIVLIYSLIKLNIQVTLLSSIIFIAMLFLTMWIVYCIQFIVTSMVFWMKNASNIIYFISSIDRLSRFPYEIFAKGIFFIVFTFIIPVTIITNVPTRALLGILEWDFVFYTLVSAVMLTLVSQIVWKAGVKRYEGGRG